jgi:hypothetical protein
MTDSTIIPLAARVDVTAGRPVGGNGVIEFADGKWSFSVTFGEWVDNPPYTPPREMTLYSQNDPRWTLQEYAAGTTFGEAGCYVCCVAMVASLTGSLDGPPVIAKALHNANCFDGNLLTRPENIPDACPGLGYYGTYRWHDVAADMDIVYDNLRRGPVIMEVDFEPGGEFNQHFVVATEWNEETGDIKIADPWNGEYKMLPAAYSPVYGGWSLGRAIYGLRCLRLKE